MDDQNLWKELKGKEWSWSKVTLSDLKSVVDEIQELMDAPFVLVLTGEVGAGKTSFVQSFCQMPKITSPTYSFIEDYDQWVHMDLYRIENKAELFALELPLYTEGREGFFIEWGEKWINDLGTEFPDEYIWYHLKITPNKDVPEMRDYHLLKIMPQI